jgi:putative glycosyltransferase (TIGR04372 family)
MRNNWKDLFAQGRAEARRTGVKRDLPRVRLRVSTENGVRELAAAAAVDLEKPIVTLHVRESGFRRQPGFRQRSFDRLRDANIDTYRSAVDALVARGVQVIRIGDASMTPRDWPGMVDLATAPWRTDAFELWAVLRSWFFLTSDSGPYFLSRLARIPSLSVNVIQVGYYTKRAEDRYICKRVRDNALGRILTVSEMLTEEFVNFALNEERYSWIDNTSADILDALEDTMELMDADAESRRNRTSAQRSHDALVANLAGRASNRRTRLGLQLGPLGRGTMAPRFAERYLEKGN